MEGSFNKLDLTGKLIIKATFGQDIRRIPIHNDDLTYDELVLMMQRVFRGALDPNEELLLRYKDEDEDLVTISDNSDLSFALQYCRLLRLTITCKGLQEGPGVEGEVVRELRDIRDRVNKLLDLVADSGTSNSDGQQQESKCAEAVEETAPVQSVAPLESREFDPLGQMNQEQAQAPPEVDTASQHSMQSSEMHAESAVGPQNGASSGYPAPQEGQAAPQYSAPPSPYPTSAAPPGPPNAQYSAAQYSAAGAPTASPMHTGYPQAQNQQQPPQAPPASFPPTQPSFNQAPQAPSYSQAPMTGPPPMGGPYSQPSSQHQGYTASSQPAPSSAPTSYTSTQAPSYPPALSQAPAFPPTSAPARPQGPPTGSFPASYPTFKPAGGPAFPPNGYAAAPGVPPTYPTGGPPSNPYSGGLPRPGAPQTYSYPGQQGPPGGQQGYPQQ